MDKWKLVTGIGVLIIGTLLRLFERPILLFTYDRYMMIEAPYILWIGSAFLFFGFILPFIGLGLIVWAFTESSNVIVLGVLMTTCGIIFFFLFSEVHLVVLSILLTALGVHILYRRKN